MNYSERLNRVIPGGAHTYSRGDDQHPSNAPPILTGGKGSQVWSPDGREFLD
jgi:glutamate-1-semialdehyde 2,1-aminomutase